MGSGVLLAALVVLWFVVLVPMVVTRGEARTASAAADSGRTLQRRRTVDPLLHAETERVALDRGALVESGKPGVNVHKIRRRALGGLVALAVMALVGAVAVAPWLWAPQLLLDLLVVGYLLVLRKVARRERLAARRAARAAAREALWGPTGRPEASESEAPAVPTPAPAVAAPAPAAVHETVAREALPKLPHPSVPLAPVHPLRPGRVVAARVVSPGGWQNSAVVGLDDDDIGFADIDVYQPRVVNA